MGKSRKLTTVRYKFYKTHLQIYMNYKIYRFYYNKLDMSNLKEEFIKEMMESKDYDNHIIILNMLLANYSIPLKVGNI